MADELKPCKYCGCDWGHTGECQLDSPGAVERSRLKVENDALRAEIAALKNYQELDGLAMRLANNELAKRRREIAALKAELAKRDSRIAELEAKLAAASRLARDSAEAAGEMVGSKRSANDRAVERIKEYAARMINEVLDGGSYDDINAFPIAETVLDIIREEAERHE